MLEFLERYSLHPESRNPVSTAKRAKSNVDHMTEEEQLSAAIMASVGASARDSPADEQSSPPPLPSQALPQNDEREESIDLFSSIEKVDRPEPVEPANSITRVQLRKSDGSRKVRKFYLTDTVRNLFEYARFAFEDLDGQPFDMTFNRSKLLHRLDETIDQAGLRNAALQLEMM